MDWWPPECIAAHAGKRLTATRASYDTDAAGYAARVHGLLEGHPHLRAHVDVSAELVPRDGGGPVADVGCGPGYVTRHLHDEGADAFGIDLSPEMVAIAPRDHPDLPFDVGAMTTLDLDARSVAGIVAFWSTIHIPDEAMPGVMGECHRSRSAVRDAPRRPSGLGIRRPTGDDVCTDDSRGTIMGRLIYATTMSLDGYVADAQGDFQWSAPSEEVFAAHLQRMSEVSTEVLGRKTYKLMTYWENPPAGEEWSQLEHEFARRWRAIERIVVSSTLDPADVAAEYTRLVPRLTLDELTRLVDGATGIVEIFGPTVAADAIRAGLLEELHLFVVPQAIGGGLRALPEGAQLEMSLVDHRRFENGTVLLRYART